MSKMIRLIYASTTTNPVDLSRGGVQTDIGRILMQARRNNARRNVGGVLYFRDNYFLQCLEGEEQAVKEVFERISKDPRHRKIRILSAKAITKRLFSDWSMKYVVSEKHIDQMLKKMGYRSFVPYEFDEAMLYRLLGLFVISKEEKAVASTRPRTSEAPGLWTRLKERLGTAA